MICIGDHVNAEFAEFRETNFRRNIQDVFDVDFGLVLPYVVHQVEHSSNSYVAHELVVRLYVRLNITIK